ncbi:hypothetical protein SESBI_37692 [Sesbania bispinosa]|nr:hypothetical protein SESBI_37692 [Sesbania bispinosa]
MIDLSYHNWAKVNYISSNSNRGKFFYTFSKKVNGHGDFMMTFINYSNGTTEIRATCILRKTHIKNNAYDVHFIPLGTSRNGRKGSAFLLPIIERERLSNERKISESGKIPCRIPVSSLCIIEVVAASPYRVEELWSPDGSYRMRLTLKDPIARIHAFVVAEDGVTL